MPDTGVSMVTTRAVQPQSLARSMAADATAVSVEEPERDPGLPDMAADPDKLVQVLVFGCAYHRIADATVTDSVIVDNHASSTAGGMVATSAPILAASMTWPTWRTEATSTSVWKSG